VLKAANDPPTPGVYWEPWFPYAARSVPNADNELTDGVVLLRPLCLDDLDEWTAGEDEQQIRWFEFPGPASRENVTQAIERWTHSWRISGPFAIGRCAMWLPVGYWVG
jgi:hypothetical protein